MKPRQVREDLKHVRSVHFALLIVSGAMLYLIIAAWSEAPELYVQLSNLTNFLNEHQTTGVPLKQIDPKKAAEVSDQILQTFQRSTGTKLTWFDSTPQNKNGIGPATDLRCKGLNVKSNPNASLKQSVEAAMSAGCKFALPVIPEDQAKAMREWGTGSGSVFGGGFWTDAYLKDFVVKGDPAGMNGSDGTIVLGQMFFAMGDDKNPPPPPSEAAKHFPVGLRTETVAFPQDWFQLRFPALHKHPELLDVSSGDASRLLAGERIKGLESLKETIFGVEIKAAHIGAVGPIIICFVLLYLLAYLAHLCKLVPEETAITRESVDFYSPWLGATRTPLAVAGTMLSVIVVPSATVFLSCWRLSGISFTWALGLALMAGMVPGIVIARAGFVLAQRKLEVGSADHA